MVRQCHCRVVVDDLTLSWIATTVAITDAMVFCQAQGVDCEDRESVQVIDSGGQHPKISDPQVPTAAQARRRCRLFQAAPEPPREAWYRHAGLTRLESPLMLPPSSAAPHRMGGLA